MAVEDMHHTVNKTDLGVHVLFAGTGKCAWSTYFIGIGWILSCADTSSCSYGFIARFRNCPLTQKFLPNYCLFSSIESGKVLKVVMNGTNTGEPYLAEEIHAVEVFYYFAYHA